MFIISHAALRDPLRPTCFLEPCRTRFVLFVEFYHNKTSFLQSVINSGVLPILANMLTQDYDQGVKKDACWTVSNITAGTEEQIQVRILNLDQQTFSYH